MTADASDPTQDPVARYRLLIGQADAALREERFEDARATLRDVLALEPQSLDARLRLAVLGLRTEDWSAALTSAQEALQSGLKLPVWLVRAIEIACVAQYKLAGTASVRTLYERYRGALFAAVANEKPRSPMLGAALTSAATAGDSAGIGALFARTYGASIPDSALAVSRYVTIQDWCAQNDHAVTIVDPAHLESSEGLHGAGGRWSYRTDACFAATVENAQVLLGWDYVMTPGGEILSDSGYAVIDHVMAPYPHHAGAGLVVHLWPADVTDIAEDVLLLPGPPDKMVGHWMVDFLPRLRAFDRASKMKIVVPSQVPAKFLDLLALFDIGDDRLLRLDAGRRYRFRSALVVQTGLATRPSAGAVTFVAAALRETPNATAPSTRLMLLRNVPSRKILNQDEFDQTLARFGVAAVKLADLSIAQQRDLLGRAEFVIAIYGSDLLAYNFMQARSHLVELNYDPERLDAAAASSCWFLGVNYHLLPCAPADQAAPGRHRKDRDFHVDCAQLAQILDKILADPR